jgi:hypothetical protein
MGGDFGGGGEVGAVVSVCGARGPRAGLRCGGAAGPVVLVAVALGAVALVAVALGAVALVAVALVVAVLVVAALGAVALVAVALVVAVVLVVLVAAGRLVVAVVLGAVVLAAVVSAAGGLWCRLNDSRAPLLFGVRGMGAGLGALSAGSRWSGPAGRAVLVIAGGIWCRLSDSEAALLRVRRAAARNAPVIMVPRPAFPVLVPRRWLVRRLHRLVQGRRGRARARRPARGPDPPVRAASVQLRSDYGATSLARDDNRVPALRAGIAAPSPGTSRRPLGALASSATPGRRPGGLRDDGCRDAGRRRGSRSRVRERL